MPHRRVVDGFYAAGADFYARRLAEVLEGGEAALRYTERNRIVLVVVLLFVIESRSSVEDENEDDEEKFARRAKILRDSSTKRARRRTCAGPCRNPANSWHLGRLLLSAQFSYLAHAPERTFPLVVRLESEIADRMSSPAHDLEFLACGRGAFKDSRLAMEQLSQVVTSDCLIHFIHISHLFLFSCFYP